MCSGKSTVGRLLAPMLGLPFIDLDRVIESRVGPLLPFVRRAGEAAFREEEARTLHEVLAGEPSVIAMGGGTPIAGGNLESMLAAGTVVWLDVPLEALMPRIERAGRDRPLLFGLEGNALQERVMELLDARLPVYARAQVHVRADAPPEETAARIAAALRDQLR